MESDAALTGPINFGNPVESTMLELAELILRLTGSSSKLVFKPLPADDPKQRCPDISKARRLIGYNPGFPIEKGVPLFVEWYRKSRAQA